MMASRFAVVALGVSTSVFALSAYAQNAPATAPLTDIRLSSGGLAEMRRQVEVKDNAALTLTVPLDQVDDVLKSLRITDPNGKTSSASLAGKQPLAEVFKNLPFSASDLASQASLIGALQGATVTVTGDGREIKGRVVGVEQVKVEGKNDETIDKYRLTVFSDGKLTSFDLDTVDVALDDAALRAKLETGLNAVQMAKAGDARDIAVSLAGSGQRTVAIDYVVPAPIWKATYRLTLPKEGAKAGIQGWAVIENNSSDDWKGVRLSLSSGSPVTLHQRLHEAYYARRPEVPVYGPNGIVPRADLGGEMRAQDAMKQKSAQVFAAKPPAPSFQNQMARAKAAGMTDALMEGEAPEQYAPPPPAETTESDLSTVFTLPNQVDLPRGQTLTVRFLENQISASRISVFQPQLGISNPVAAVVIRNESASSLPPGILTLTEEGSGYAGDAQLAGLPAGETRMVMFATDRKVQVATDTSSDRRISQIVYDKGALKASVIERTDITYRIKGAQDADRTVIIEYPRNSGYSYTGAQIDSETPATVRLKVNVAKGGIAEAKLTEQKTTDTSYSLADLEEEDGESIAAWSLQATSDPQLVAKINAATEALSHVAEARRVLAYCDAEVERIKNDQSRVRENLRAVPPTSDLAKTYLANMAAQENRLSEIASLRANGEKALRAARAAFSDKLKAF